MGSGDRLTGAIVAAVIDDMYAMSLAGLVFAVLLLFQDAATARPAPAAPDKAVHVLAYIRKYRGCLTEGKRAESIACGCESLV
jgi:hypothetical protein